MADGDNDQRYPFHWRHDKKTVGTFEKLTISTVKTVRSSIWVVVVSLRIHSNVTVFVDVTTKCYCFLKMQEPYYQFQV